MIRPVLLTAIVVCSLGAPLVAVQPAAGDVISETPTHDGSDDPDSDDSDGSSDADGTYDGESHGDDADGDDRDDRWYDRWRTDRENRSDDNRSDDNRSDDENRSEYWAEEDRDGDEAEDGPDGRDGNGTADDGDSEPEEDRPENTTGDERHANGTEDDRAREDDGADERDRLALSVNGTVYVLDVTGAVDHDETDATTVAVERGGVSADASASDEVAAGLDLGEVPTEARVGEGVATGAVELLPAEPDGDLHLDRATVDEILDGSPILRTDAAGDEDSVEARPSVGDAPAAGEDRGTSSVRTVDDGEASAAEPSGVDAAGPAADATGDGRDGTGPTGEGPAGGSPAGAGAALFVTVGCLGGTRVAVTQANLLASPASEGTLATLRRFVGEHLSRLADGLLPAVFGYSRRDDSDPLENETRAAIYDLVRESPGIYNAQLAEETGVAVETVRYHSRILAEEGLVEAKKLRGRRRLFPVTMDDDDPELAAAIADSAAADVLSAIDRLEPATLSAVADAVDCAPSTVAHHLDRLEEDGLVTRERDGGAVRLRLRRSTRSALQGRVADD